MRSFSVTSSSGSQDPPRTGLPSLVFVEQDKHISDFVAELNLSEPTPVVVLIGGASRLSDDVRRWLVDAIDRGLGPAVSERRAVVITGGTQAGVMQLTGELLTGRQGATLIGVAPGALVDQQTSAQRQHPNEPRRLGLSPAITRVLVNIGKILQRWFNIIKGYDERVEPKRALQPEHNYVVLTPGLTWGSETETMFALANKITRGFPIGTVLLANGGRVSRYETQRFLAGGWPVIAIGGTKREADALVRASRAPGIRTSLLGRLPTNYRKSIKDWGADISTKDVETHELSEPAELLYRRLLWRLSSYELLKDAWTRFGSYDVAANGAKAVTRRLQWCIFVLSVVLVVSSLVYGMKWVPDGRLPGLGKMSSLLRGLIVALPVATVVAQTSADTLVPPRTWIALRQAAEAIQRAIYRYRAAETINDQRDGPQRASVEHLRHALGAAGESVEESGVSLATVPLFRGRPSFLGSSTDEFGPLTRQEYLIVRLDRQLSYYRSAAIVMRRKLAIAILASASLAATATVIAAEDSKAVWVPVVVFLAATITVLQQRARWQDRIKFTGVAVAQLSEVRGDCESDASSYPEVPLYELVDRTETILEREQMGWSNAVRMGASS